jgi:RNA polymerase sigma factor
LFPVQDIEEQIRKIKQGDNLAREDFLESQKPFIFKAACKFSKRFLEWGRDDELAVALIAFNEAIDRFREDSGVPFLAYARMVITSRLTDLSRRENRNAMATVPLPPPGEGANEVEFARAWDVYCEETAARERVEEIKEFEELLNVYGVSFEDLVKCSPRHRDTRQSLMLAAKTLVEKGLFEALRDKKKLPLAELEKETGISRKTLERGRKYIIAMSLIIFRRDDFLYLGSYLNLPAPGSRGV